MADELDDGMKPSDLVGAWHLVSFTISRSGHDDVHPFGADAHGRLVYSPDGHMAAVLSRSDRAALGVGGLESAPRAPDSAKAAAFDSYMSYAGRYRIEGHEVVHDVDLALTPDVVGNVQRRTAHLDGRHLVLTYERPSRSGVATYRLTWTRAEAP